MRVAFYITVSLLCAIFIAFSVSYAEEQAGPEEAVITEETVITADTVEQSDSVYKATGSVRITRGDVIVEADEMSYDQATSEAELSGNVKFESPDVSMAASRARLNIEDSTGMLYDARALIKKDNYKIAGREMEKKSGRRYFLKTASLTTCDGIVPAWCFKGRELDVLLGDRVKGWGVSFRVKDVPVIYTPYLWAPILTDRKTGLLMPTVGFSSTKGFYFRQPFFWAITENRDITVFPDVYARRGVGEGIEYRYIERGGISGSQFVYHLRDDALNTDFYEIRGGHEYRPSGRRRSARLAINYINRNDFIRLYKPYVEERSRRFLESSFEVEASFFRNSRAFVRGSHMIDLRQDALQRNALHRLPEAGYVLRPVGMGRFTFSLDSSASNFARKEGTRGRRAGAGMRATHTAGREITLSQSAQARGYVYDLEGTGKDSLSHASGTYGAVLEGRWLRRYSGGTSHALIPSLSYKYIQEEGDGVPLFDSAELRPPQSTAQAGVVNRFSDKEGEFLNVSVTGETDSRDGRTMTLGAVLRRPFTIRSRSSYDLREGNFTESSSEAEARGKRFSVNAGQRYSHEGSVMLYTLGGGYKTGRALSLEAKLWYDSKVGEMTEARTDLKYLFQCWGLNLSVVRRPHDYSVFLSVDLKGVGAFEII